MAAWPGLHGPSEHLQPELVWLTAALGQNNTDSETIPQLPPLGEQASPGLVGVFPSQQDIDLSACIRGEDQLPLYALRTTWPLPLRIKTTEGAAGNAESAGQE